MIKKKIGILCLFLLTIFTTSYIKASINELPLLGKVIYLDAGHGLNDPGAFYKKNKEKDINLSISLLLEKELIKQGAIVHQTRYGDYNLAVPYTTNKKRSDLSRRGNMINESNCDLYLSIHLNAESTGTWQGAQTFYDDVNSDNKKIAEIIQKEFTNNLYTKRKAKKVSDLYLSRRVTQPGVLLELGFLSNSNDRYLLKTENYQKKLSKIITNGVIKYFEIKK